MARRGRVYGSSTIITPPFLPARNRAPTTPPPTAEPPRPNGPAAAAPPAAPGRACSGAVAVRSCGIAKKSPRLAAATARAPANLPVAAAARARAAPRAELLCYCSRPTTNHEEQGLLSHSNVPGSSVNTTSITILNASSMSASNAPTASATASSLIGGDATAADSPFGPHLAGGSSPLARALRPSRFPPMLVRHRCCLKRLSWRSAFFLLRIRPWFQKEHFGPYSTRS